MQRIQVNDQYGGERLQTRAQPIAQTGTVQQAPDNSQWEGLAKAFASGEFLATQMRTQQESADQQRAQAYANSMTVSELGKKIKAGEMMASESPVFAATVQHVWGENSHAALSREVLSKVTTGELKLNSPEEIDTYLTEARNSALSGQSKYTVAGFDKGYQELRTNLMNSVAKVNDKEIVEKAGNEASDSLGNALLKVTGKDFTGTPQEAANTVLDQYHLLRHTKVMPDGAAKGALAEVLTRAAAGGQTKVLDALLNSELPDVGSVRSFLGETKAQTLIANGKAQFDQGQRKRLDDEVLPHMLASDDGSLNVEKFMGWANDPANKDYISSATVHGIITRNQHAIAQNAAELRKAQARASVMASEYDAQRKVDAALSTGSLFTVQGTNTPKVLTHTGDTKDFDVVSYAEQALKAKTANMPFQQQVSAWSMNGLINPDWDKELKAGLFNLASIGVDAKGKPTGQLNDAGKRAIALFGNLDAVSPDAARQTAGEGGYKRFSDIAFLVHMGRDVSDAASIAANVAQGHISEGSQAKLSAGVSKAVTEMTGESWLEWLGNKRDSLRVYASKSMAERLRPFAGAAKLLDLEPVTGPAWMNEQTPHSNTVANTSQVHAWVSRYAQLLAQSGQVGDADSALKAAVDYISNPKVSTRINGTLYLRSELPTPPNQMKTQDEWFAQFLHEVPKARAKELGFDGAEVRLELDERTRTYRAFVAGLPMTDHNGQIMAWHSGQINQWYTSKAAQETLEATTTAAGIEASHKRFKKRLNGEVSKLQKDDPYVMERYDGSYNGQLLDARIMSKEAFQRITKDGNGDKSLAELMKLYPAQKQKAK